MSGSVAIQPEASQTQQPAARPEVPAPLEPRRTVGKAWLTFFTLGLAGYALGGRGFAYIGVPPIFISEVILLLGVATLLFVSGWVKVLKMPTILLMIAMMGWCLARTLPYISEYKFDALRDAMLAGYMLFAVIVAAVIVSQPELLPWTIRRYQTFARVLLMIMPGLWLLNNIAGDASPKWPWADVPILDLKAGDTPVHLGAIAALMICGLFRGKSLIWALLLCLLVAADGAVSRGGLISFLLAATVAFTMRPDGRWARRLLLVVVVSGSVLVIVDPQLPMPGRQRDFSVRQIALNLVSVVGDNEQGDLDDTKKWRLQWWGDIVDYTVHGEYFWEGKGFGVNLANSDGYQVLKDDALRSPHNGHLTVLARGGVPAFTLWLAIQLTWLYAMFNGYVIARQRRDRAWAMVFVVLVAYYMAIMLNGAFDVYLEGPMGALWCWAVVGFGLAAAWLQQRHPRLLDEFNPEEALS